MLRFGGVARGLLLSTERLLGERLGLPLRVICPRPFGAGSV
jgi:hypothetical protein